MCLDISYIDADGHEHQMFDICDTHLQLGFLELLNESDAYKKEL